MIRIKNTLGMPPTREIPTKRVDGGMSEYTDPTTGEKKSSVVAPGQVQTRAFEHRASGTKTDLIETARDWEVVKLTLLTADDVVFGTQPDLRPVTSGKGHSLIINRTIDITLEPNARLYLLSVLPGTRVGLVIQGVPWLEVMGRFVSIGTVR